METGCDPQQARVPVCLVCWRETVLRGACTLFHVILPIVIDVQTAVRLYALICSDLLFEFNSGSGKVAYSASSTGWSGCNALLPSASHLTNGHVTSDLF